MTRRSPFLLLLVLSGCSSGESIAPTTQPSNLGSTASAASIRDDLAKAIVLGASRGTDPDAKLRRDVEAWTARLSDRAICAAAQRADEHPLFALRVGIANVERSVVFDLASTRAAVFTRSMGEPTLDRARLYAFLSAKATAGEGVAPPFDDDSTTDTAPLDVASSKSLRAFVGLDGSMYSDSFAVSPVATRALTEAMPFVRANVSGDGDSLHLAFKDAPSAGLDAHGATAAAILGWTRTGDPLATKAALIAVAAGHARDACAVSSSGLHTSSLRPLGGDFGEGDFDLDAELGDWFDAAPSETSETSTSFEVAPSCATDPSLACGGGEVCAEAASSFCCAAERPVTKPCANSSECGAGEACVMASNEPDADGNILTCADASGAGCAAVSNTNACVKSGGSCSPSKRCCSGTVCAFGGERDDTFCQPLAETAWEGTCTQPRKGAAVKVGTSSTAKTCRLINGEEYPSECFEQKNGYCVIGYNGDCGSGEYAIAIGDLTQLPRDQCKP